MRLTIDIDSWWFSDLQKTICTALDIGLPFPNVIRKSSTKRGYHVIWRNLDITFEECIKLREILNDDPIRIKLDAERVKKPKQVLFRKKKIVVIK